MAFVRRVLALCFALDRAITPPLHGRLIALRGRAEFLNLMGDTALKKTHAKLSHEPIYLSRRVGFTSSFNDLPSNFNSIPTNDEHKPLARDRLWAADQWIVPLRCRPPLLFGQHVHAPNDSC
jgi:hypothetical protein